MKSHFKFYFLFLISSVGLALAAMPLRADVVDLPSPHFENAIIVAVDIQTLNKTDILFYWCDADGKHLGSVVNIPHGIEPVIDEQTGETTQALDLTEAEQLALIVAYLDACENRTDTEPLSKLDELTPLWLGLPMEI